LFHGIDVLVEAFDAPKEKVMLVNAFSQYCPTVPLVMASGIAGYAPSNWIKTTKMGEYLYIVGDMKTAAEAGQGLMAPRVGVAAHHQANQVLRIVLGHTEEDDFA
jgi:sulfur carrier protein ThiS adenylyltransferase